MENKIILSDDNVEVLRRQRIARCHIAVAELSLKAESFLDQVFCIAATKEATITSIAALAALAVQELSHIYAMSVISVATGQSALKP